LGGELCRLVDVFESEDGRDRPEDFLLIGAASAGTFASTVG
jgi:hypothetical protein